jgi:hypothetical protein
MQPEMQPEMQLDEQPDLQLISTHSFSGHSRIVRRSQEFGLLLPLAVVSGIAGRNIPKMVTLYLSFF